MVCQRVTLPGGQHAIVCGPRRRPKPCACGSGKPATLLCDWKVGPGSATGAPVETCDRPLCVDCTTSPAPDKDLCPDHAAQWKARAR